MVMFTVLVYELQVFLFALYKLELWTRPLTLKMVFKTRTGLFAKIIQKEIQQMVI